MEGWIRLHRQIKNHWIWKSPNRFQWWMDILLSVNHADNKVLIKGQLLECKRGQSVRSLESWAKDWNVTKKTVKEFFELLQKDSMLVYEGIKITTRITVCNYDSYQDAVNTKETKGKRKVNTAETETTPKQECKEGKEEYIYNTFYDSRIENCTDESYILFVKFLFGENDLGRPFNKLLKMDDQIDYKKFLKLRETSEQTGKKIFDTCRELENYNKKSYASLYLTLLKWLKNVR